MPLLWLLIAAVAAFGVHVWLDVLPEIDDDAQAAVIADPSAEIAGQTLSLTSATWDEYETPEGTRSLSVLLHASGGPEAADCGFFTLAEPATDRLWKNARRDLDVPYDAGETSCIEESAPYEILAVFLLPDDATGPFEFDVPGDEGAVARFIVEP